MDRERQQRGQGAVEVVAILPAVVLLVVVGWQLAAAAHAWVVATDAARTAARAEQSGASAPAAARELAPRHLAPHLQTTATDMRVRVASPRLLRAVAGATIVGAPAARPPHVGGTR